MTADLGAVRTPVRGREAELAFIEARLDALARGEGGIVRVEGPAGIGRTRILAQAAASARRRGTRVFQGAADPDEQFVPLGPLLEGLLSGTEPLAGAARLRDLAAAPGQRFWLLQELGDRLQEAARNAPLLVVLDDLQWCDDLTLLTLHTLAARLSSYPVLWLVAVTGGSVPPGVRTTLERIRQAGAHELVLGALEEPAIERIAEDLLGAAPGPDVLRVARRAEGVPLLLVEILGALREEELVTIENGTAGLAVGSPAPRRLPSVERRLGQLSDSARELAQAAAVVGRPVTVALLAELLGRSSAALITAVRECLDADLLAERDDRLEFRHDLVRESVEAGLPLSLRQALRRQAAELLPETVTFPTATSPTAPSQGAPVPSAPVPSARAVPSGEGAEADRLRAAAAELAATAPGPAAELGVKALELTAAGDRTAGATLMTVDSVVRFHRADWTGAFRQADRAAALAAGLGIAPELWAPEALWHGVLSNAAGRSAEALAAAEDGIRTTRARDRESATRRWLTHRARLLLDAGRLADARADAEAASAMTDEPGTGNAADVMLPYTLLRTALHANDQQSVQRYAMQARRMRGDSAPLVRAVAAMMVALVADFDGRPDHALAELADSATAFAEEPLALVGAFDPADAPVLVRLALRAGTPEHAAKAVAAAERRAVLNPGFAFLAATAAHARGLLDNDLGHLLRAVRLYEDCPRAMARASALEDTGRRLALTRKPEALPHLDAALALYVRAGAERDVARVRRRLRAAGVRRRPSPAGHPGEWPELTAAEVRVARLVAQGLTNLQVAERLSLSPHTVSSHLRRAFTKLDLTSRAELTRLVRARDSGE